MVIGITGHPGSGKDTAADYLVTRGFVKVTSDIIREKMKERGIPTDRSHMREFIENERKIYGNGYPIHEVIKNISSDTVVAGLRNTEEVRMLQEAFGKNFTLLALEIPQEVRYERVKKRLREGDDISFEQFKEEEREERMTDSGSHEVDRVIEMADSIIINNGSREDLSLALEKYVSTLRKTS